MSVDINLLIITFFLAFGVVDLLFNGDLSKERGIGVEAWRPEVNL